MIGYVEKSSGLLFSTHDLRAIMDRQTAAMRAEVEKRHAKNEEN